ncbi:MAG TPA: hypothetical protein VIC04_03140 [Terriglobia bacterium]|jgi:hypothetical protein
MNRLTRFLLILFCFELGVLLVIVPWSDFWERNFFLDRYPELIPWLLNPFVRGAITGLGLLDIWIAASWTLRGSGRRAKPAT